MCIYFETFGCTLNQGDTEELMGIIAGGNEFVESAADSELVVINSCGVIERTEKKIQRRIKALKRMDKKVLVAGCLPRINPKALEGLGADSVLASYEESTVESALRSVCAAPFRTDHTNAALRFRRPGIEAVVKIADGCLGHCSYCATKFARGKLRSRLPSSITAEVRAAIELGYKEIRLTSLDSAAYGADISSNLAELLRCIAGIPGEFKVRVGMMNPEHAKGILEELTDAYACEKIYKFLHMPLQSGDDRVLEHMRRRYTAAEFMEIVKHFRERFTDLTLSTDIIVGYPTEDEESFARTYEFIEELRPDILNITRFSPRPGTPASKLKDMPNRIKKMRSRKLTALHRRMGAEINRKLMGSEMRVLVTERGKGGTVMGRTDSYKAVVMTGGALGEFSTTKISGYTFAYLNGDGKII